MSLEEKLTKHFAEDEKNFLDLANKLKEQENDHLEFRRDLKQIRDFMENLSGFNDLIKGGRLLKTPSLWILGLVLGTVALMGGFKTIIGWFINKA